MPYKASRVDYAIVVAKICIITVMGAALALVASCSELGGINEQPRPPTGQTHPMENQDEPAEDQSSARSDSSDQAAPYAGSSNASNSNHPSDIENPSDIEMTPLQRETLARLSPAAGFGVIAQTAGVSPVQSAVGAGPAERLSISVMHEDGTVAEAQGMVLPTMRLMAFSDLSLLADFSSGARQIIEGRMFALPHEAVVSREFAELNGLSIGDSIEFASVDLSIVDRIRMELVGIYSDATPEFAPNAIVQLPAFNRRNEILVAIETLLHHPQFAYWLAIETVSLT